MNGDNTTPNENQNADSSMIGEEEILEVIDDKTEPSDDMNEEEDEDNQINLDDEGEEDASSEVIECASTVFSAHTKSVFCIDAIPSLVASGGEDDRAFVWDPTDGQVRLTCDGHADSVTHVRFNARRTLLATGDMSGRIQVWDVATFRKVAEYSEASDLEWLLWHNTADVLFAGAGDGLVWMWLVPKTDCKVYAGHGARCTSGRLLPDGKKLLAGYDDGVLRLWNLKEATNVTVAGLSLDIVGAVLALDCSQSQPVCACGTEKGIVGVVQVETGRFTSVFEASRLSEDAEAANSVETLAFAREAPLLASGSVQGQLNVWDLNSKQCRHTVPHPAGVVKVLWLDNNVLVSACLDGALRLFDARDGAMLRCLTGHTAEILDFCVSDDSSLIMSSSEDSTCRVFCLTD